MHVKINDLQRKSKNLTKDFDQTEQVWTNMCGSKKRKRQWSNEIVAITKGNFDKNI